MGDRQHEAGRGEAAGGQDVMDEMALQPPVALRKGPDVEEAEGEGGSGEDGVHLPGRTAGPGEEAVEEGGRVPGPSRHMAPRREAERGVVIADGALLPAEPEILGRRALSQDPGLQVQQQTEIKRPVQGRGQGAGQAMDLVECRAVAGKSLARLHLHDREHPGHAPRQVVGKAPDDLLQPLTQVAPDEGIELFAARDQRAERRAAGQVVPHPVAADLFPRDTVLQPQVEHGDTTSGRSVRQVQPLAHEPFIEEPDAAGMGPGRLFPQPGLEGLRPQLCEQALEQAELQPLVAKGEDKMPLERRLRRKMRRQDPPALPVDVRIPFADGGKAARQRPAEAAAFDQRGRGCGR